MKLYLFLVAFLINCSLLIGEAQDRIFKEYDIRGIVGAEFEVEDAYDLGMAIGTYLLKKDSSIRKIALGADGRIHSPAIKKHVCQALLDIGLDVLDIGICTTPVMYFSLHTEPVDAGLMITASHNPGKYNGIKIATKASSIYGKEIKNILAIYQTKEKVVLNRIGKYEQVDMIGRYIECMENLFPHLKGANINAIVDCGNGAAGTVLPLLIEKMQWKNIQLLYPEVDGTFPHHEADPIVESNMQDLKKILSQSNAQLGIGFDGDCDRMAPMSKSGYLVKGDQLLTILSKSIVESNPGTAVVFDISSSLALHKVIKKWGGNPILSGTGIATIKKTMREANALIGGEISCHTIFRDRFFGFDDGLYSMLRLFELMAETGSSLDELIQAIPLTFTSKLYRIPCSSSVCNEVINMLRLTFEKKDDVEIFSIDGIRIHFPFGWAIVRASNTEPLISIRFEAETQQKLENLKNEFRDLMAPYFDCSSI